VNKLIFNFSRLLRKIYRLFKKQGRKKVDFKSSSIASKLMYDFVISNKTGMIARFGAIELAVIVNYIGVKNKHINWFSYIQDKEPDWCWNQSLINQLSTNAGFFPPVVAKVEQFCELMLHDKKYVDILGSWLEREKFLLDDMKVKKVHLWFLEPFWSANPWTYALKDKKILVVHPFVKTIVKQYQNREKLFANKDILPTFRSLDTIKAVQGISKDKDKFNDWFEALEYMKSEIDKIDYDICLIGAGAYGFPLAAHVKRQGKMGIHMGGALQLLFGIRGKRWEDPNYGVSSGAKRNAYVDLVNEYWVRPNEDEKPEGADKVEGGCYW